MAPTACGGNMDISYNYSLDLIMDQEALSSASPGAQV